MSNRAEELYFSLYGLRVQENKHITESDKMRIALIDAELRKEKERAARRVRRLAPNSMDKVCLADAVAAILSDEED